eukprot:3784090-Rhodomonas_salina.4
MPRKIKGICGTGSTERAVFAFDLAPARRGPSGSHSRDARGMPRALPSAYAVSVPRSNSCIRCLSTTFEHLCMLSKSAAYAISGQHIAWRTRRRLGGIVTVRLKSLTPRSNSRW